MVNKMATELILSPYALEVFSLVIKLNKFNNLLGKSTVI